MQANTFQIEELLHTNSITIAALITALLIAAVLTRLIRNTGFGFEKHPKTIKDLLLIDYLWPAFTYLLIFSLKFIPNHILHPPTVYWASIFFGSLAIIRFIAMVLRRMFLNKGWTRLLISGVSYSIWLLFILNIFGLLGEVLQQLKTTHVPLASESFSLLDLIQGLVSIAVTLFVALWLSALIEDKLMKSPLQANIRVVIGRVIRAFLFFIAVLTALSISGIDLSVLSVFGGALGVGLGFGMQKIMANYISGFLVLIEGSLRVGDRINVDGFIGEVTSINTRYTVVKSPQGIESVVPNEMLITTRIENLTLNDNLVSLNTAVGVAYDTDIRHAIDLIKEGLLKIDRVLNDPPPNIYLRTFADSSLNLEIYFWINDASNGQLNVISDVNLMILDTLRANHIVIPFPQRVVNINSNQKISSEFGKA